MPTVKDWPHAPIHRISSGGIYMVTGATVHKAHLFPTAEKLNVLEQELLTLAKATWMATRGVGGFRQPLSFRCSGS